MKTRNLVGARLEMSQAEIHPHTRGAQLSGPGEKNKLIGLARMLPKSVIRASLRYLEDDTMPLSEPLANPLSYGGEATVFVLPGRENSKERVLKLYHSRFSTERLLEDYKASQDQMQTYFPGLVVPAGFFVYQGRFSSEPCLAAVQERVDGVCLFGAGKQNANPADVARLFRGTDLMAAETGHVPDFSGAGNVLVDQHGNLRIVDSGIPIELDDIDITANLRPNLEWLASSAQSLEVAKTA